MDKWLKQFQKLKSNSGNIQGGLDYMKYFAFFGIIITNGIFVLPQMKKMYNRLFSNNAEITHVVNILY